MYAFLLKFKPSIFLIVQGEYSISEQLMFIV